MKVCSIIFTSELLCSFLPQEAVPPVVTVASTLRKSRAGHFIRLVEQPNSDREVLLADPDGATGRSCLQLPESHNSHPASSHASLASPHVAVAGVTDPSVSMNCCHLSCCLRRRPAIQVRLKQRLDHQVQHPDLRPFLSLRDVLAPGVHVRRMHRCTFRNQPTSPSVLNRRLQASTK